MSGVVAYLPRLDKRITLALAIEDRMDVHWPLLSRLSLLNNDDAVIIDPELIPSCLEYTFETLPVQYNPRPSEAGKYRVHLVPLASLKIATGGAVMAG
jgi:hypothetical protein